MRCSIYEFTILQHEVFASESSRVSFDFSAQRHVLIKLVRLTQLISLENKKQLPNRQLPNVICQGVLHTQGANVCFQEIGFGLFLVGLYNCNSDSVSVLRGVSWNPAPCSTRSTSPSIVSTVNSVVLPLNKVLRKNTKIYTVRFPRNSTQIIKNVAHSHAISYLFWKFQFQPFAIKRKCVK